MAPQCNGNCIGKSGWRGWGGRERQNCTNTATARNILPQRSRRTRRCRFSASSAPSAVECRAFCTAHREVRHREGCCSFPSPLRLPYPCSLAVHIRRIRVHTLFPTRLQFSAIC